MGRKSSHQHQTIAMPQRTSINVMSFLQHYRMHPCLWNRYHPHFKNRNARDQAEAVLLPISGVTNVKELRQKIRNIRCTYNQELAKIRRSINSGSAEIYEPKLVWFAFADSFLRVNHIEKFDDPETHSFYGSSGGQMVRLIIYTDNSKNKNTLDFNAADQQPF